MMRQPRAGSRYRTRRRGVLLHSVASLVVATWLFPLAYVIVSSFKPAELFGRNFIAWVFSPTLEHYRFVLVESAYPRELANSIVVSLGAMILSVGIGTLAGYSLARFKTGGKNLAMWFLGSRIMPPAAVLIPFFVMFNRLGIIETRFVLILSYMVFNLSFVVWMSRSFFLEVPVELEEAAMVDGSTRLQAFWGITLALSRTGIMATIIFSLIFSWNEYLFATVLTNSDAARTLPAGVGKFLTHYQIVWGPLFAESTLIIFPVLLAGMILQRHLIRGITMGALK